MELRNSVAVGVSGRRILIYFEAKLSATGQAVLGGRKSAVIGGISIVWMYIGMCRVGVGVQASDE